jgi:hypothetical protein
MPDTPPAGSPPWRGSESTPHNSERRMTETHYDLAVRPLAGRRLGEKSIIP